MDSNERKIVQELVTTLGCVIPASDGYEPRTNLWNKYTAAKNLLAAAPQVVADEHSELAYTDEEAREEFLAQVRHLVGHWERESRAPTAKEKLEGLAFSIMNIFDGTSGLPAFDIVCAPHPDDKQYHIDEGSKYFVPGMVINECHLHEILFDGRAALAAAPVQAQEPVAEVSAMPGTSGFTIAVFKADDMPIGSKVFRAPVQPVAAPDPLYQAMRDFRDDVLSGIDGLDNDQINAVLGTLDNYMLDEPAAPAAQGDAEEDRAKVLEEAANICEGLHKAWRWDNEPDSDSGPRSCAAAIRAAIAAKAAS